MNTGIASGNDFLINSIWGNGTPSVSLTSDSNGNYRAFISYHGYNGTNYDIVGMFRVINPALQLIDTVLQDDNGTNIGNNAFLITRNIGFEQLDPAVLNDGNHNYTVWQTNINGPWELMFNRLDISSVGDTIWGYLYQPTNGNDLPHGPNNFFVSPLIERDYSVSAKMFDALSESLDQLGQ